MGKIHLSKHQEAILLLTQNQRTVGVDDWQFDRRVLDSLVNRGLAIIKKERWGEVVELTDAGLDALLYIKPEV